MSTSERDHPERPTDRSAVDRSYEPPRIVWREPYTVAAQQPVSCARQPGNPGCNPGPLTK